jgi:hypothetical protein
MWLLPLLAAAMIVLTLVGVIVIPVLLSEVL